MSPTSAGGGHAGGRGGSVLMVRPEELRRAARMLHGVGEQVQDLSERTLLSMGLGDAWSGLAALEQQARTAELRELVAVTARPGRSVAQALERAAGVAESAGARAKAWSRRVEDCGAELTSLRTMGPPPDPLLEQVWRRRLQEVDQDLARARVLVEEAEREWQRVEQEVAAVVSAAWTVVTELDRARQVLTPVLRGASKTWSTLRAAGLTTATVVALAQARWQGSAELRRQALRRASVWLRELTAGRPGSGKEWSVVRKVRLVPGPLGWALTYVGAVEEVRTGGGHTGRRGDITRVLAGGALLGGPLILTGVVLPPAGLAGIAAVSAYQAWTAGNLAYDNRASLVRYARGAVEVGARADRALAALRIRAQIRLAEAITSLRDPRTWTVPQAGPLPRVRVRVPTTLDAVLGRLPDTGPLRDRLRQVGEPLRLPGVPLPPTLAPVHLGAWRGPPGAP